MTPPIARGYNDHLDHLLLLSYTIFCLRTKRSRHLHLIPSANLEYFLAFRQIRASLYCDTAITLGRYKMSTTRRRSGRKGSAPAKKKSYGPSANAQGQSVDASQHIEKITELLKDNRASVQLKGFDFVNVSDEQINQMFHNNSLNFTAPPLHHRR